MNPAGYHPADLQKAYALTAASAKATGTVAIVDAFNDPSAEADLGVYRKQFGLPVCTTANGCFKKINQNGAASPLPPTDNGWSEEISLDLDMVSAVCPHCKIILVEATSNSFANLGAAAKRGRHAGARRVEQLRRARCHRRARLRTRLHQGRRAVRGEQRRPQLQRRRQPLRPADPGRVPERHGRGRHRAEASVERAWLHRVGVEDERH